MRWLVHMGPHPDDTIVYIPLRRSDGTVRAWAMVDPADAPLVAESRWHLQSAGYAARIADRRTELMHRVLLGLPRGDRREVDHINRDRLDNRRGNLRLVTNSQNQQNRSTESHGASKYRNVRWRADRGIWTVVVKVNRRAHYIGGFRDEDDAGRAAAEARALLFTHSREDEAA